MEKIKSDRINYVYRITNLETNKHYYGSRSTKKSPKCDLGVSYFSSSSDESFIKEQKMNPKKFKYKIIMKFRDRKSAISFESKLHIKLNVSNNENFYNKSIQTSDYFDTTGKCIVKIGEKNILISSEEYQKNKNLYNHINKNRHVSDSTKLKLSSMRQGTTTIKDFYGNFKRVHMDYLSDSYEIGPAASKRFLITSNSGEEFKVVNLTKFLISKNLPMCLINERDRKRIINKDGYVTKFNAKKYKSPVGWRFVCID